MYSLLIDSAPFVVQRVLKAIPRDRFDAKHAAIPASLAL
jgi:hypothetical protein